MTDWVVPVIVVVPLALPVVGFIHVARLFGRRSGWWCASSMVTALALNMAWGTWSCQASLASHAWTAATLQPLFTSVQNTVLSLLILFIWLRCCDPKARELAGECCRWRLARRRQPWTSTSSKGRKHLLLLQLPMTASSATPCKTTARGSAPRRCSNAGVMRRADRSGNRGRRQ